MKYKSLFIQKKKTEFVSCNTKMFTILGNRPVKSTNICRGENYATWDETPLRNLSRFNHLKYFVSDFHERKN